VFKGEKGKGLGRAMKEEIIHMYENLDRSLPPRESPEVSMAFTGEVALVPETTPPTICRRLSLELPIFLLEEPEERKSIASCMAWTRACPHR
jgi:hypothetical protein